jgi:tRNA A37 threonylcarbamoyladenosine dehydratase
LAEFVFKEGKNMGFLSRTENLIGKEAVEKLQNARVAVFGIGGVGGYVVEALARSGVGAIDLIDNDKVALSNINRQIIALHSTVGEWKTEVAAKRIQDINPDIKVRTHNLFFLPETANEFDFDGIDYVVDAIDTVSGKIALIESAKVKKIPVISSMGTGNKLNPTSFEVADITKTSVCPLARVMRRELKKRGIEHVKVVYSKEEPKTSGKIDEESGKSVPASISFVPSVAGLIIAGEVIKDLIK